MHQNPFPFRWTSLALALHLAVFLTQYLRWSVFSFLKMHCLAIKMCKFLTKKLPWLCRTSRIITIKMYFEYVGFNNNFLSIRFCRYVCALVWFWHSCPEHDNYSVVPYCPDLSHCPLLSLWSAGRFIQSDSAFVHTVETFRSAGVFILSRALLDSMSSLYSNRKRNVFT